MEPPISSNSISLLFVKAGKTEIDSTSKAILEKKKRRYINLRRSGIDTAVLTLLK